MRNWHGGLSSRADLDPTPVIKPDGTGRSRESPPPGQPTLTPQSTQALA